MKLLHVISSMDPRSGGPCAGIRNLAPVFRAVGNEVEIVCLDDPDSEYLAKDTLRIHALGRGQTPWSYHPALLPWLAENLPRFDAVILNGLWQYPGYALFKLAQRPNLPPYIIFPHGMLDPWFQRAPERRLKAVRNWLYWKLIEQRVVRRAGSLAFTCVEELRLARETFRPYRPRREVVVGYGINPPPEKHAGMARAFAEKCPGLNGRPYFLYLSRIHPKKGVDLLIRAYAEVFHQKAESRKQKVEMVQTEVGGWKSEDGSQSSKLGEQKAGLRSPISDLRPPENRENSGQWLEGRERMSEVRSQKSASSGRPMTSDLRSPVLIIAGPGLDTEYGQQMQRLADELTQAGVGSQESEVGSQKSEVRSEAASDLPSPTSDLRPPPSIFWPGMLNGDAKWGALYGCEAFVLSSHQENFGIAVVEAMACGKPVLISDQINIWREIAEDKAGLVEPDTLAGTTNLFQKWEALPLADKLAMNSSARLSYQNRFDIASAAGKLMAALERMVAKGKTERSQDKS